MAAVFKASCFPFLNCFASFLLDIIFLPALPSRTVYSLLLHLDPREKISSPVQDLFCSRKPLTYPGPASVQCGLYGRTRTENPLSQALTYFTQTSVSYWTLLLSRKSYTCTSATVQSFWAAVNAVKLLNLHILELFVNNMTIFTASMRTSVEQCQSRKRRM